jgi:tricorn protease
VGGPSVFVVDADRAVPQAGAGRLNITLRANIDPKAEFKQIFYEGWRNQRDYLYVPNMHGSDWPKMRTMYEQLLPFVMHRADLNYLLDQMGAEIAIGHSYVRGGDIPEVPAASGGQLGADFTIDQGRYKITKIYDAESWNPDLRAPLAGPGVDVRVGDYILAVNGEELQTPDNLYRMLDGTANHQVVLTLNSRASMDGARRVTVIPVANDQGLRTRSWVEHNRHVVDSLSLAIDGLEVIDPIIGYDPSASPVPVTGKLKRYLKGYNRDPVVTMTQNIPLPVTLLGLTMEVSL